MSKYTTEIRYLCETLAGQTESAGYTHIDNIISLSVEKIFDFNYPIFDSAYKTTLESKILRHFYTREICEETYGLWKLRLEDKMNLIMPYYNQLYESSLLKFNPLYDVDITRDRSVKNTGESNMSNTGKSTRSESVDNNKNGTSANETKSSQTDSVTVNGQTDTTDNANTKKDGTSWKLFSDTPQGGINGITNDEDSVANNTYLTNVTKDTIDEKTNTSATAQTIVSNTQTSEGARKENNSATLSEKQTSTLNGTTDTTNKANNIINNTEEYIEHVRGKQGTQSYSSALKEFRETFLNIDEMIINDLSDLFFGLW